MEILSSKVKSLITNITYDIPGVSVRLDVVKN